jgi:predicted  nucleic acid-binding Zn-ribbon protein
MHVDLERLIRLQTLDNEVQALKRTVDTEAERRLALDTLLDTHRTALADAREAQDRNSHDRREVEKELARARDRVGIAEALRGEVAASLPTEILSHYEALMGRRGSAVVEARDGHCTFCHVRLRPKVFLDVRRNDLIVHCDSCQRILFYNPPPSHAPAPPVAS